MKTFVSILLITVCFFIIALCVPVTAMDMAKGGSAITVVCMFVALGMCVSIARITNSMGMERSTQVEPLPHVHADPFRPMFTDEVFITYIGRPVNNSESDLLAGSEHEPLRVYDRDTGKVLNKYAAPAEGWTHDLLERFFIQTGWETDATDLCAAVGSKWVGSNNV